MFYLFIFESIGTSELVLIGLVALIVFGPRKLPEFARTIGKTMAEFRRSTDDFKKTWQKELDLEEAKKGFEELTNLQKEDEAENKIITNPPTVLVNSNASSFVNPEIRELSANDFNENLTGENVKSANKSYELKVTSDKQEWL